MVSSRWEELISESVEVRVLFEDFKIQKIRVLDSEIAKKADMLTSFYKKLLKQEGILVLSHRAYNFLLSYSELLPEEVKETNQLPSVEQLRSALSSTRFYSPLSSLARRGFKIKVYGKDRKELPKRRRRLPEHRVGIFATSALEEFLR